MIVDGLRDCLSDKHFTDIGVSELCGRAEVSRSTFYRLFDTTTDVLQYLVDSLVKEASDRILAKGTKEGAEYIRFYLDFIEKNIPLFETILMSGRIDILSRALTDHATVLIPADLLGNFSTSELDYLKAFSSSAAVSLYRVNIQHGKTESAKDLWEVFKKVLKMLYENIM